LAGCAIAKFSTSLEHGFCDKKKAIVSLSQRIIKMPFFLKLKKVPFKFNLAV